MEHNKLVRDKIPEIIEQNGDRAITHIANDEEYKKALEEKLYEEIAEFLKDSCVEEAADIMEVLEAICKLKGDDLVDVEKVRLEKADKRGRFEKRIILEKTE